MTHTTTDTETDADDGPAEQSSTAVVDGPNHADGSDLGVPTTAAAVRPVPETAVPAAETPAASCPYCERPFRAARQCALHVADAHADVCTAEERESYEAAREAEDDDLFVFHLKVVFALGTVYAVFIIIYIIAFSIAG